MNKKVSDNSICDSEAPGIFELKGIGAVFSYLHYRRWIIFVLVLCVGIFAAVFSLYGLPMSAVVYGSAVCAAVLMIFTVIDFRGYRQRLLILKALREEITLTTEHLPAPSNEIEGRYNELIRILSDETRSVRNTLAARTSDMTEYCTMWVHQIKTPIAAMRLTLQGMEDDGSGDTFRLSEDLQRIEQYAEMVLCYARLDSDSTDYVIRRCKLDDVIKRAVRGFSAQFIRKKISLDYTPTDAAVLTDEKWLLFVLEQVISNALKYTKRGTVSICFEENEDGGALCVRDTGVGIAPEDIPRIFEKGFTGCNGRADKRASGIGLYLCGRICAALGHEMTASSVLSTRTQSGGTEIRIIFHPEKLDTRD